MTSAVRVRFFGPLTDQVGNPEETIEIEFPTTPREIRAVIELRHPTIAGAQYRVAVDETLTADDATVTKASELALLPPFSGG